MADSPFHTIRRWTTSPNQIQGSFFLSLQASTISSESLWNGRFSSVHFVKII